ncbi:MAG: enoyl-CoA hydratase [Proteobacteria bacterium]|nr:enoyl-CoA hydratase [Pseudomonadota bacterium]
MAFETIAAEKKDNVGLITLNRPDALNALCDSLVNEMAEALDDFEADAKIGCIVITGSEKAFAAGADIKEMQGKSYMDAYQEDFITRNWERVVSCRKPVIAAVQGYALGGGCELAMMCDFIIAAENAKFGQPEISLGVTPGAGGSQRLTRFVGKSKAMEMCLTGRMMDADEAERSGLASRVLAQDGFMDAVMETAAKVASMSRPVAMMVKEVVNRAYEMTLSEGVRFERRMFQSLFATDDQKEGMAAFVEKRKPEWKNR